MQTLAAVPLGGLPVWLPALAFGVPALALYIWFRRRQRAQVSYLRIWERVAKRQQNSWWRWLRWVMSVLLALSILVALVSAASHVADEPDQPPPGAPTSHHLIVLVDPTVSLATADWSPPAARDWLTGQLAALMNARQIPRGDTLDVIVEDRSGVQLLPRLNAAGVLPGAPNDGWPESLQPGIHRAADWATMQALATGRAAARKDTALRTGTIPQVDTLLISDGQPLPAFPAQPAPQTWRPADAAAATRNMAIVGVQVTAEDVTITLAYTANDTASADLAAACRVVCAPEIAATEALEMRPGETRNVRIPLPDQLPADVPRGSAGPHTWRLTIAAELDGDARRADNSVTLTLPVQEPVPVIVAGTGVDNPLIIPLIQLLQSRGICRLVTSRDQRPGDEQPVLLQLDDLPTEPPLHAARIHFGTDVRGPGDLVRPGNLLEWPTAHGLFRVDDIAAVPLAVRQARVFAPIDDSTVPLITGPHGTVADFTPGRGSRQPSVRIGFSLAPANSDFLLQPGLAPLLIKRLLRLVAPPVTPPVPPLVQLGQPLVVDFAPGSALAANATPQGRVTVQLPGNRTPPRDLQLPAPPLRLQAGTPQLPGTARVTVQSGPAWQTAVQRLDATESAVPPATDHINEPATRFFPPAHVSELPAPLEDAPGLWPTFVAWLLLMVLGLLLIESVLYRFRLAE